MVLNKFTTNIHQILRRKCIDIEYTLIGNIDEKCPKCPARAAFIFTPRFAQVQLSK
jgi:hypothetical protein